MTFLEAVAEIQANPRAASDAAWRVLRMRAGFHAGRAGNTEDVQQEVMIMVLRAIDQGTTLTNPNAFVRSSVRRRKIDDWRTSEKRYLSDERIEARPDPEAAALIELRAQDPQTLVASVLDAVSAEIETARPRPLPAGGKLPTIEALRTQMRATLLRAMGHTVSEVRAELAVNVSDDLVAKWIERGREPLLAAIDRINVREAAAPAAEMLRTMVAKRRADVGRSRKQAA